MQLADHLKIIIAAELSSSKQIIRWRHIGTAFHIGGGGMIATCSHIIKSKNDNEQLFALTATDQRTLAPLEEIIFHPKYDFAVAKIDCPPLQFPTIYSGERLYVGDDVLAFSYFNAGSPPPGYAPNFQGRLFKGHISSLFHQEREGVSPSTCEISFPSIAGFSGAPLLHGRDCILGMLYGNSESTIELYRYEEVTDEITRRAESIHRLVEFGLVHSAMDIRRFLKEMGVKNITDGPTEAMLTNQPFM